MPNNFNMSFLPRFRYIELFRCADCALGCEPRDWFDRPTHFSIPRQRAVRSIGHFRYAESGSECGHWSRFDRPNNFDLPKVTPEPDLCGFLARWF